VLGRAEVVGDSLNEIGLPFEASVARERLNFDSVVENDDRLFARFARHHRFDEIVAFRRVGKERFSGFQQGLWWLFFGHLISMMKHLRLLG
jgi:hypothetical protein